MNEMIGHIFGSLDYSEKAIKEIKKVLNNQVRFNRKVALFSLMCGAFAVSTSIEIKKQQEKISNLTNEIEELKRTKGE